MSLRLAPVYLWPNGARLVRALDVQTLKTLAGPLKKATGVSPIPMAVAESVWPYSAILIAYTPKGWSEDPLQLTADGFAEIQTTDFPMLIGVSTKDWTSGLSYLSSVLVPYLESGALEANPLMIRQGQVVPINMKAAAEGRRSHKDLGSGRPVVHAPIYAMLNILPPWLSDNQTFLPWWEEIGSPVWSP